MKKLLYALAFAIVLGSALSSCTDDNVQPTSSANGAGGTVLDPK
jgi:hypothetical protein